MRAALAGLLLALAGMVSAQDVSKSSPEPGATLRDAEFGVQSRQFGLQRKVTMLQWQKQGDAFARTWSERPIDSSAYPAANHNPSDFPLQTRYWIADRATLDGQPIDDDVLKALGQWRDFRPNFSALPGNLSATFQPEGDGLGSADNPLDPQIGDLRVTWRELALPPLAGKVVLADGAWVLNPDADVATAAPATAGGNSAPDARPSKRSLLPIGSGVVVVLIVLLAVRARKRRVNRS